MQEEQSYRVSKEIRETVIFAPQNLVMDPPFTKVDLITCRNLLIYLETDLQHKILSLFHYSLNPGGILMLGSSESTRTSTDLFAPFPGKSRFYSRQEVTQKMDLVEFPRAFLHDRTTTGALAALTSLPVPHSAASLEALTNALLLRFTPAAVLSTRKGDIVYISGKTGKYLEPATGKANLNIISMAREGLAGTLNAAFSKVVRQKSTIILNNITVGTNGGTQAVEVTLQYLSEPAALHGMVLIVFADIVTPSIVKTLGKAARTSKRNVELTLLTQELQQSRDELQTTREEMQSSQEELKSTNEELQSTNEELQSANEELTTSKEEMQSMNEEMQTVNHELVAKVTELEQTSDDMKNLLNSTDIATLFLDAKLRVRRFTTQITSIIKLIPGDTGRPITDLVTTFDYPQMTKDVREVLRTLLYRECQVSCHDGRWLTVCIMPYRTQNDRIDGVVITFTDVTKFKELESTLRETLLTLQNRFSDQTVELNTAKTLEMVLNNAQTILEQRFSTQTEELKKSRAELKLEKRKQP